MQLVKQNIWILCPNYQERVAGYYETNTLGQYLFDQFGKPIVERTHCFQKGNICPYFSCVLNKNYNGMGGTYPTNIEFLNERR